MNVNWLTTVSTVLIASGLTLLFVAGSSVALSAYQHERGIQSFRALKQGSTPAAEVDSSSDPETLEDPVVAEAAPSSSAAVGLRAPGEPDMTDWSAARIAEYRAILASDEGGDVPEAIMRIPSIDLEVPVFAGTEERNLTRGAGRIEGTPPAEAGGNTGIAAHRDGYFRSLKDVAIGDHIEMETLQGLHRYRVAELFVVEPHDVSVLDATDSGVLTLVTCYPFYFVGSAPQRYIVRAHRL